jgi:outer membrane lipoprotein-sorting protein
MRTVAFYAVLSLALIGALAASGCRIRRTVKVNVPEKILQAKTAGFDELISLINSYSTRVSSLSSGTMKVTYTSGKLESGVLQSYHSAPGYLLLKQPDKIRINIQNPITKTSVADILSLGNDFQVWSPTQNRLYIGKNGIREFVPEGQNGSATFTMRPVHLYEALIPSRLVPGTPGLWIALEEDQDSTSKYYVLSAYREGGGGKLFAARKIWIERAGLTIAKQQVYEGEGRLAGIIRYSDIIPVEGVLLPLSVRIERPGDGYMLDLAFRDWKLNPVLEDNAFALSVPEGAERIQLREKGRTR